MTHCALCCNKLLLILMRGSKRPCSHKYIKFDAKGSIFTPFFAFYKNVLSNFSFTLEVSYFHFLKMCWPYNSIFVFLKQLVPLGNTSQFQPRELFQIPPPPPSQPPPPLPPNTEPLYAYPASIYGTLPKGPPRPVDRPTISAIFHAENEESSSESDSEELRKKLAIINYATFRQNISADAAAAAVRRAEVTAQMARNFENEELPTLTLESTSSESSFEKSRDRSPSPSPSRRSKSPGKNVTFLDRSLEELESSPRKNMITNLINKKRRAPSPPPENNTHEALGARLSASLRQTFKLDKLS